MRRPYMDDAPWWVIATGLAIVVGCAAAVLLCQIWSQLPIPLLVLGAVLVGTAIAVPLGRRLVGERDDLRELLGDLTLLQREQVARAANQGIVPEDPVVRERAAELVEYYRHHNIKPPRWLLRFSRP